MAIKRKMQSFKEFKKGKETLENPKKYDDKKVDKKALNNPLKTVKESSDPREAEHIHWTEMARGLKKDGMNKEEIIAKLEDMGLDSMQAEKIADEVKENQILESNFSRLAQTDEQENAISTIEKWLKKLGKHVTGGDTIGKHPQTVILDLKHHGSEIYVNTNGFEDKESASGSTYPGVTVYGVHIPTDEDFDLFKKTIEKAVTANENESSDDWETPAQLKLANELNDVVNRHKVKMNPEEIFDVLHVLAERMKNEF